MCSHFSQQVGFRIISYFFEFLGIARFKFLAVARYHSMLADLVSKFLFTVQPRSIAMYPNLGATAAFVVSSLLLMNSLCPSGAKAGPITAPCNLSVENYC